MAYLHQLPLINAVKRLYMMGHSDRKPTRGKADSEFGAALGGAMFAGSQKPKAQPQPQAAVTQESEPYSPPPQTFEQMGQEDRLRRGTMAEQGMQLEGRRPEGRSDVQKAIDNLKVNNEAADTRIGGQLTTNGLQKADKDATANAIDSIRLKQMMLPQPMQTTMPQLRRY